MTFLFDIRVEAWESNGENLGWLANSFLLKSLDLAKKYAHRVYVENFVGKQKQIAIFKDGELVWRFHKKKETYYGPTD